MDPSAAKIRGGKVQICKEHIKIYKNTNFQNSRDTFQVTFCLINIKDIQITMTLIQYIHTLLQFTLLQVTRLHTLFNFKKLTKLLVTSCNMPTDLYGNLGARVRGGFLFCNICREIFCSD